MSSKLILKVLDGFVFELEDDVCSEMADHNFHGFTFVSSSECTSKATFKDVKSNPARINLHQATLSHDQLFPFNAPFNAVESEELDGYIAEIRPTFDADPAEHIKSLVAELEESREIVQNLRAGLEAKDQQSGVLQADLMS